MINFDNSLTFRFFDIFRVNMKKIFTKLGLRDKQSCKYCGRNQYVIWSVSDEIWEQFPEIYLDTFY